MQNNNNNIFSLCCITTGLFKDNVILIQWFELNINLNALCVALTNNLCKDYCK